MGVGWGWQVDRAEERAPRSRALVAPAAALWLGAALGPSQAAWVAFAALVVGLALAGVGWAYDGRTGAYLAVLSAFAAAGFALSTLEARTVIPDWLRGGGAARLVGVVEGAEHQGDALRLDLAVARVEAPGAAARFRVRLFGHGTPGEAPAFLPGQRLLLTAKLTPLQGPQNPGQADWTDGRRRRGLVFSGSFAPEKVVVLSPAPPLRRWMEAARAALTMRSLEHAPSREAGGLFATLSAGMRTTLSPATEEAFARSGLVHVLSVSGVHVAILALGLLRALRVLGAWLGPYLRGFDPRRLAAAASVPLVWGYVLFTGSQPPAVRSAVMMTVVLVGLAAWRRADALSSLSLAALVVVVADPSMVGELSMQLSFLAVLSLLVLAPALRRALPVPAPPPGPRTWRHRALDATLETVCASVAVTLAGAPLAATAFHRLSLAGVVSNVVTLPLCGALTAVAAGAAGLFVLGPPLAVPLIAVGGLLSELLLWVARGFAAAPLASLEVPGWTGLGAAAFWVGLLGASVTRGRWRRASAAVAVGAMAWWAVPWGRPAAGLEVTFLSVGQGDAVLVSSGGAHALFDGGGVARGADPGKRFVVPLLRGQRVRRLQLAVLSHPHADHALGLASTLEEIPTDRLWLPAGDLRAGLSRKVRRAAAEAQVEAVRFGRAPFKLGEAWLEVVGPPLDRADLEDVNDRSVVVRVWHRRVSFLLTGDIESPGEEALGEQPQVTVLKAPHHGSRTSSSPAFLERARPKYVVFCVGLANRFGFPHEEVVERYRAAGAKCFRTDVHGAVRFHSDGDEVRVETFRPALLEDEPAEAREVVEVAHEER